MEEQQIFSVTSNTEGRYTVNIPQGMSVEEVAFSMAVIIKCFDRDKVMEKENMLELIKRYVDDKEYDEVQNDGLA